LLALASEQVFFQTSAVVASTVSSLEKDSAIISHNSALVFRPKDGFIIVQKVGPDFTPTPVAAGECCNLFL
jgi:hypothetical protein